MILRVALGSHLLRICFPLLICSFFDAKVPPLGIPLRRRDPDSGKRTKESLAESTTQAMLPTPPSVENGPPLAVRNSGVPSARPDRFPDTRIALLAPPVDSAQRIQISFARPNMSGILAEIQTYVPSS